MLGVALRAGLYAPPAVASEAPCGSSPPVTIPDVRNSGGGHSHDEALRFYGALPVTTGITRQIVRRAGMRKILPPQCRSRPSPHCIERIGKVRIVRALEEARQPRPQVGAMSFLARRPELVGRRGVERVQPALIVAGRSSERTDHFASPVRLRACPALSEKRLAVAVKASFRCSYRAVPPVRLSQATFISSSIGRGLTEDRRRWRHLDLEPATRRLRLFPAAG